jgi:stage II sporulation protein E
MGFFIGRTMLFGMINPVATGFLGALIGTGYSFYATAAFMLLGIATRLEDAMLMRYFISLGVLCSVNLFVQLYLIRRKNLYFTIAAQSSAAAACTLLGGLGASLASGFSLYSFYVTALESALVFFLVIVLKKSASVLTASKRKNELTHEEVISLAILFGCIIAGAADIYVGEVSLRFFLTFYFVMLAAFLGDASIGASAGLLSGMMLYIAGYWDVSTVVALSMAGFGAGLFKSRSKAALLAAYIVVGGAAFYFLTPELMTLTVAYSFIIAALCFFITPKKFNFHLTAQINPVMENAEDYVGKMKNLAVESLNGFSESFERLARTYSGLAAKHRGDDAKDVSYLIDDVAVRACGGCPKHEYCWEENFYGTYQSVFGILDQLEKKGRSDETEANEAFVSNCVDISRFFEDVFRLYEIYKTNRNWEGIIAEDRELVSQQIAAVSGIIKGLAEELDASMRFNEELEEKVLQALVRNKIEVDRVIVLENKVGKYEVSINHKFYYDKKRWNRTVSRALSGALKRKMIPDDQNRTQNYQTKFIEERRLRVTCGVARTPKGKKGESGDSYSFMELKNGECLLALSDGMGTGRKAQEESAAAVDLLETFLESGFDKNLAVKIINSVLVLKSGEESFATLDICSIDLYSGEAEFIKIGAAATFLLRDGKVFVIRSTSLPIGMLKDVDMEVSRRKLYDNDILLMVTDGLLDASDSYSDKEDWIVGALRTCNYINPQDIADHLLLEGQQLAGGLVRDDMTVLAARIWEK